MNIFDTLLPPLEKMRFLIRRSEAFPGRWLVYDRQKMNVRTTKDSLEEIHNWILEKGYDGQTEEYHEK